MEIINLIMEILSCLIALKACGLFVMIVFIDIKENQHDIKTVRHQEK